MLLLALAVWYSFVAIKVGNVAEFSSHITLHLDIYLRYTGLSVPLLVIFTYETPTSQSYDLTICYKGHSIRWNLDWGCIKVCNYFQTFLRLDANDAGLL